MNNKIGILTFHRIENYGAVLQCYALLEKFKEYKGDAHVLDYVYKGEKLPFAKRITHQIWYSIRLPMGVAQKKRKFKQFLAEKLDIKTKPVTNYRNIEDLSGYNAFVVGSDQVWNFKITNDPVYRLTFANSNQKKYSYAASLGADVIADDEGKIFREDLISFSGITVREQSAIGALSNLGINASHVLDPTLLLNSEEWNERLKLDEIKVPNEGFVFCYVLPGNATSRGTVQMAKELAEANHLRLIVVGDREYKGLLSSNYKTSVGVDEFVAFIKNAEFVITNSFHGTCFSIIYKKQFYTTIMPNNTRNNRIVEMLSSFCLEGCIVDLSKYNKGSFPVRDIDYEKAYSLIEPKRTESLEFIQRIVQE